MQRGGPPGPLHSLAGPLAHQVELRTFNPASRVRAPGGPLRVAPLRVGPLRAPPVAIPEAGSNPHSAQSRRRIGDDNVRRLIVAIAPELRSLDCSSLSPANNNDLR